MHCLGTINKLALVYKREYFILTSLLVKCKCEKEMLMIEMIHVRDTDDSLRFRKEVDIIYTERLFYTTHLLGDIHRSGAV